jgi:hypothetical protein
MPLGYETDLPRLAPSLHHLFYQSYPKPRVIVRLRELVIWLQELPITMLKVAQIKHIMQ